MSHPPYLPIGIRNDLGGAQLEILNKRIARRAAASSSGSQAPSRRRSTFVTAERESAVPIMGLMMLAASKGTVISIRAAGEDAEAAVEALAMLVRNRFDED